MTTNAMGQAKRFALTIVGTVLIIAGGLFTLASIVGAYTPACAAESSCVQVAFGIAVMAVAAAVAGVDLIRKAAR
jgi:hypothetical protein